MSWPHTSCVGYVRSIGLFCLQGEANPFTFGWFSIVHLSFPSMSWLGPHSFTPAPWLVSGTSCGKNNIIHLSATQNPKPFWTLIN